MRVTCTIVETSKRGRGQRRSRRLKNVTLDDAQRAARRHLYYNPRSWGRGDQLAMLTASFRGKSGISPYTKGYWRQS